MRRENVAVIDGDSLCYICSKDTIETSIKAMDSIIKDIMTMTNSNRYIIVLSEGKYFRHGIDPYYKSNRAKSALLYLKTLKNYLKEKYKACSFEGLEAEDSVAYIASKVDKSIICAIDKDVLEQIPGVHYNYKKREFVSTDDVEADKFLWKQVLMGDSTDNISGIKGVGEAKAKAILEGVGEPIHLVFNAYLASSSNTSEAIRQFQKNFRLVYILRNESDLLSEVGYVIEYNQYINDYKSVEEW